VIYQALVRKKYNHMKAVLSLLVVAFYATVAVEAQPLFSFGLNYNWSNTKTSDNELFNPITHGGNLYPRIGFLFKDVIAVGVTGGAGISRTTNEETDYTAYLETNRKNWFIGPFVRFCTPDEGKLRFLLDCSMRIGETKVVTLTNGSQIDADQMTRYTGYYLEPGISYKVNNRTSIEMSIGNLRYTSTTDKNTGTISSGYYASLGLASITGRLMYTFGDKKTRDEEAYNKFK